MTQKLLNQLFYKTRQFRGKQRCYTGVALHSKWQVENALLGCTFGYEMIRGGRCKG